MFFYEDVTPDRFPMPHALHQCTYRKLWTRWWLFKKKKGKGIKLGGNMLERPGGYWREGKWRMDVAMFYCIQA